MNWQPITSTGPQSTSGFGPGAQTASATDPLTSKETFLKLLIAQIQHQNPLQPADGVEFVSQLTQISGLEQSLGMRQSLEGMQTTLGEILAVQQQIQNNTQPSETSSTAGSGSTGSEKQ